MSTIDPAARGLNRFARSVTSQHGEDGILAHLLETIGSAKSGWCVEFGAWDGKHLSNTWQLIEQCDFAAVLIEGDRRKFRDLQANVAHRPRVLPLNRWVAFQGEHTLDAILHKTPIPQDFDVLSIDIDGNDYHVWDSLVDYRPKIVVIEFNPSIPHSVDFVQPADAGVTQGSSLRALDRLARVKGYQLVATTVANGIFVDERYYAQLGIEDNSIDALHTDDSHVTYLFQGYDGTLFVRGCNRLVWHGVELDESRLQQLPAWLRKHPAQLGRWASRLMKWYRRRNAA